MTTSDTPDAPETAPLTAQAAVEPAAPVAPAEIFSPAIQLSPQVAFLRQPWVQNVLPFATSLGLHLALLLIGWATYKTVQQAIHVVQEQIIIPESTMAEIGPPGGVLHPGLGNDPTREATQDITKDVSNTEAWSTKATSHLNDALAGEIAKSDAASLTKLSATAGPNGANIGMNEGEKDGQLASWGPNSGGGGNGPKTSFLGTGGNARKVIYLCDCSGSMLTVFESLKDKLKESIDQLVPIQSFDVIFFADGTVDTLSKEGLMGAGPQNKRTAYAFIEKAAPAGQTNPLPAIKFAMSQKPDLIYLLTDGFENVSSFDDVINAFRTANTEHKTKISCIYIKSEEDKRLLEVLRTIARENGGSMKIIDKADF